MAWKTQQPADAWDGGGSLEGSCRGGKVVWADLHEEEFGAKEDDKMRDRDVAKSDEEDKKPVVDYWEELCDSSHDAQSETDEELDEVAAELEHEESARTADAHCGPGHNAGSNVCMGHVASMRAE